MGRPKLISDPKKLTLYLEGHVRDRAHLLALACKTSVSCLVTRWIMEEAERVSKEGVK